MFLRSLNIWFWAIVGLPTLLAGVYFFAIASDLYLSEVKFLVRGPTKSSSALSALLSSAAVSAVTGGYATRFTNICCRAMRCAGSSGRTICACCWRARKAT